MKDKNKLLLPCFSTVITNKSAKIKRGQGGRSIGRARKKHDIGSISLLYWVNGASWMLPYKRFNHNVLPTTMSTSCAGYKRIGQPPQYSATLPHISFVPTCSSRYKEITERDMPHHTHEALRQLADGKKINLPAISNNCIVCRAVYR